MNLALKRHLPRRTFLRGVGAAIALPLLDSMIPAFGAKSQAPCRAAFVYFPNGVQMDHWTPVTEGDIARLPDAPAQSRALGRIPRSLLRAGQPDRRWRTRQGRWPRRPRPRRRQLPHRRPSQEDLRQGHPDRRLRRPVHGPEDRIANQIRVSRTRHRRRHPGRQLR